MSKFLDVAYLTILLKYITVTCISVQYGVYINVIILEKATGIY